MIATLGRVKFIEYEVNKEPPYGYKTVDGGEGVLIEFGLDCGGEGEGSYSTGIIKMDDGSIKNITVEHITFINP